MVELSRKWRDIMAVKLRLLRMGAKRKPFYRIVAADSRVKRDGKYIELVGTYNPVADPAEININKKGINKKFHEMKFSKESK